MSTEVALIPATAADRWKYAESMAASSLLPDVFRGKPANAFWAVEYAAMLGLSPMVAFTEVHVIEGKPTASASLMIGLAQAKGHKVRLSQSGTVEGGDISVTCTVVRSDDPDHPYTSTWDLRRALIAELIDRLDTDQDGRTIVVQRTQKGRAGSWQKYTLSLLKARAKSEACRDGAEDALLGMHYTPEELGVEVDEDGSPVDITASVVDVTPAQPTVPQQAKSDRPNREPKPSTPAPAEPSPAAAPAVVVTATVIPDVPADTPAADPVADALGIATLAATCGDVDKLVATFQEAGNRQLLTQDVTTAVHADLLDVVGIEPGGTLNLGTWLMAAGKYVRANGGMSVHNAAYPDEQVLVTVGAETEEN